MGYLPTELTYLSNHMGDRKNSTASFRKKKKVVPSNDQKKSNIKGKYGLK